MSRLKSIHFSTLGNSLEISLSKFQALIVVIIETLPGAFGTALETISREFIPRVFRILTSHSTYGESNAGHNPLRGRVITSERVGSTVIACSAGHIGQARVLVHLPGGSYEDQSEVRGIPRMVYSVEATARHRFIACTPSPCCTCTTCSHSKIRSEPLFLSIAICLHPCFQK